MPLRGEVENLIFVVPGMLHLRYAATEARAADETVSLALSYAWNIMAPRGEAKPAVTQPIQSIFHNSRS